MKRARARLTLAVAFVACLAPLLAWWLDARLPDAERMLWRALALQMFWLGLALSIARERGGALHARLGLVRGQLGALQLAASVCGTLALSGALAFAVAEIGIPPRSSLGRLDAAASAAATESPWLLLIAFGIAPGVCEELLFRGALQRSLEVWLGGWCVGVTALAFALVHLDPLHTPAALPLGLYLGALAWRARTTWLPIFCHVANNCAAALPQLDPQLASALPQPASWPAAAGWLAICGLALALFWRATPTPARHGSASG